MKQLKFLFGLVILLTAFESFAQRPLQYYRPTGKAGLNVYEPSKNDTVKYDGFKVRVGGDFAIQFQGIDHSNTADNLVLLGSNLNLPAANLNLDVQLDDGLRMHLRTYLSSRHHNESWVKGGYIQMDKLDFIKPGFLAGVMKYASIRVGLDEINYGDAHFRRSDNAGAIYNPFVGNYLMDAFSTEAFMEVNLQTGPWLAVLGITNGKLNQSVVKSASTDNKISFLGKLGYDNQITEDLRVRLTGSWYINKGTSTGGFLYAGDRAGSRYFNVMEYNSTDTNGNPIVVKNDFSGRVQPRFKEITAIQFNPFVKYKGFEFFGIYERASGSATGEGALTQLAAEALYRFGANDNLYLGGRYNVVNGNTKEGDADQKTDRLNLGGGWFLTNNILMKAEYVKQTYSGDGYANSVQFNGGQFNGFMIEAVIGF